MEVQFLGFGIEQSQDCFKDYLEIGDQKVCGKLPYQTVRKFLVNYEIKITLTLVMTFKQISVFS